LVERALGSFAVGAPGFGKYGWSITLLASSVLNTHRAIQLTNSILVNDALCLDFCGGHGCGVDRGRRKESA
jgi:hypothetical protein